MTKKRKIISILVVVLVVFAGVFLFWKYKTSNQSLNTPKITEEDRSKLVFGIVKTTNFTKKTTILGYDKDLNLVVDVDFPFTNVGHFANPTTFNKDSYFGQVIGHEYKHDGKEILEVNLKDFSYKTYEVEPFGLYTIAENKTNVFGTTNSNGISYITVTNKESGNKKTIELKAEYISLSFANDEHLFVISAKDDLTKESKIGETLLYVYNNDLELVKSIELEQYKFDRLSKIGNKYYFANDENNDNKYMMYIFDENTLEIEKVDLQTKNVVDVEISGDYYILGSANFLPPYDGGITFKNIKTGEEIFHKLESGATRMFKVDNYLYVFHIFEDNKEVLAKYEINGTELKKVKEVPLKKDDVPDDNQFVTGMFLFEK
ncbi:conserved domain protein [Parvimonas sp. oral taxon 393 str. F0440]|nr:conserved domain protein [Parvimonas sp. oral taxon 393 str. F0440]